MQVCGCELIIQSTGIAGWSLYYSWLAMEPTDDCIKDEQIESSAKKPHFHASSRCHLHLPVLYTRLTPPLFFYVLVLLISVLSICEHLFLSHLVYSSSLFLHPNCVTKICWQLKKHYVIAHVY